MPGPQGDEVVATAYDLTLLAPTPFGAVDEAFEFFHSPQYNHLSLRKQFAEVNSRLLLLILNAPKEAFLLPATIAFMERVNSEKLFEQPYLFSSFEFWLNNFSDIDNESKYLVRGKIAGKYIPRESYQSLFPIGMGKVYFGSHFAVAHQSPDVDTTMAAFWGWLDAFAAKVGTSLHYCSIPEGPPSSAIITLFQRYFGKEVFTIMARNEPSLILNATDLLTQKNFIKAHGDSSISRLDHGYNEKAVILVDETGYYCGDWRSSDVELIRQVVIMFKACLHWFENCVHIKLITLFAQPKLHRDSITPMLRELSDNILAHCDPVLEYNEQQKGQLDALFSKVLLVTGGLAASFADLSKALEKLGVNELCQFFSALQGLEQEELFTPEGQLVDDRSLLFHFLETIFKQLDHAIFHVRNFVERLDISMRIKSLVLQIPSRYIFMRTDVDEMRAKMDYPYTTVVLPESNGKLFPLGVVWGQDLRRSELGSVTFRDFSNFDEVRMANYLSLISVIDHHRSCLHTDQPPMAIIGDAQSCNVLLAEQAFAINDRYSTGNMSPQQIKSWLATASVQELTPKEVRLRQRMLKRLLASSQRGSSFVHPAREMAEYLFFLHAILDDTDLLSKVSQRDVLCVAELLNRLCSLAKAMEVEEVSLDDIPNDEHFAKLAAKRLLQNQTLYGVYKEIYALREQEIEKQLLLGGKNLPSSLFIDTKEFNSISRVGQTKLFAHNISTYQDISAALRTHWLVRAREIYLHRPELDLHMHMISTIASAEDVYHDRLPNTLEHKDELWIWLPDKQQAIDHLATFLNALQNSPFFGNIAFRVELSFNCPEGIAQHFERLFGATLQRHERKNEGAALQPLAVLFYPPGAVNSRKTMISPYLPRRI